MNKKFTTLLAGLVLMASTASAATVNKDIKLKEGANDGLYQIVNEQGGTKKYLMVDKNGLLSVATPAIASYSNSLWCVNIDRYVQGQTPKFDFTNRMHGFVLDLDLNQALLGQENLDKNGLSAALSVGGDIAGWAFSSTYANGVEEKKPLFSYFKADSVIALKVDGNAIKAVKLGADQVTTKLTSDEFLFSLESPTELVLTKDALNKMLGSEEKGTSFQLTFGKVADPNVFANELTAVSDTLNDEGNGMFVTLINKKTGKYLRVDTAYSNTTGVKFVQITDTTSAYVYEQSVKTDPAGLNGRNYAFQFKYFPAKDSMAIWVNSAITEKSDDAKKWIESDATDRKKFATDKDDLRVLMQDLGKTCVLTIGEGSSDIKLGFATCKPVATTKTTVPSDLYVIKSADGKYLAVPLHDQKAQWITLEKNVNVWTMPSFQWVVEQNSKSDISPIKITNREFGNSVKVFDNVQLDKNTAVVLDDEKGVAKGVNPGGFIAATAEVKADSLLGYKYLNEEDLQITRYKFRYLHEFSDDYYVGVNSEVNDSILYVGGKSPFALQVKDKLAKYGYKSDKVAGLKDLYRQSYTLKIRNAKLIFGAKAENVAVDAEGRFAISDYFDGKAHNGKVINPSVFYIKTNNEKAIDEKETLFYAFVNLETPNKKAGTDDNNLWLKNQIMTESRTSAFSVEVDESPLYRRFNTEKEGVVANDDPDTLKFFRVNNPADMLFEDAHSTYSEGKEINFLGVNNNIQFPDAKRAIYVDTAYVNRGTGYIKPQYLLGVDVRIIKGKKAEPCPLDHNHGFDKDGNALNEWTCSHATPGTSDYVRARYLINAVDSAKVGGYDGEIRTEGKNKIGENYIWNNQVRLAFVEAIHKADTLYILKGDTAAWADPVDFSKLPNKIRLDNNLHKNVVFSFRLLEEGSDNFLIESAATQNQPSIAPMKGGWVKIQNGVPVVSYDAFDDAANESEIFNVEKTSETPTENESLSTSEVSIQTIAGAVIVKNAAGKSVKVTNILGQPLAETVLTSDNATVGVPAGIVVVAIEGEDAVKTVVK